jgi:YbbR domain-containing protein
MKGWLTANLLLKLTAALLTLVLYLFVRSDGEQIKSFFLPVTIEVPEDQVLSGDVPRVRVTLRGRRSALERLEATPPPPLTLRAQDARDGAIELTPELLQLPPGLEVTSIQPPTIDLTLDQKAQRLIPVTPRLIGAPREGFEVTARAVEPAQVTAAGPDARLKDASALTEIVDLTDRAESFEITTALLPSNGAPLDLSPGRATLKIQISPLILERTFEDLRVAVHNTRQPHLTAPDAVLVTLRGPRERIQALTPALLSASVDAHDEDMKPPGTYNKRVQIDNLPPQVEVVQIQPPYVNLTTLAPEPSPEPRPQDTPHK